MTAAGKRMNKARGKADELDIARRIGGRRHLADSGGPEDVAHDWLSIQVKGGKKVMTGAVREGVAAAQVAAANCAKLPVCAVVDRSGTRLRRYVVIDLDDFKRWFGIVPTGEE